MKLSSSSSIFFATLALSSSTSTLAAPARDVAESGLSVSPSSYDIFDSSVHPAAHCSAHRPQPQPTPVEGTSGAIAARSTRKFHLLLIKTMLLHLLADALDSVGQIVSTIPGLGPILKHILDALFNKISATVGGQNLAETDSVSAHGISSEDMAALEAAIHEITQALGDNTTVISKVPASSPVKNVPSSLISGLPKVVQSDFDPAGGPAVLSAAPGSASPRSSAQASSTPPSLSVNVVPSSSSTSPSASASATPPSPVIPVNPPNSPSLPVQPPVKR
jgi:hypothetical protein